MSEMLPNGVVKYREKEQILTTSQLLERGTQFVGHSTGWIKEVRASDLSPYKPKRRNLETLSLKLNF